MNKKEIQFWVGTVICLLLLPLMYLHKLGLAIACGIGGFVISSMSGYKLDDFFDENGKFKKRK